MKTTTANWQAVVAATLASRRADCGHIVWSHATMRLRTEKVGSVLEVWSVCSDCATDQDWIVREGERPFRTRNEFL